MMESHAQTIRQHDSEVYHPPTLALFFHAFPHLNITCHLVNATFDPDNTIYLESLGILGSLPAAWLILTLLVLLIYLLTRCCDRKPRPKHSIVLLKWTLAIFTLLCCAAVGFGLYGNDDVHNGLVQFVAATQSMDDIITAVKNQVRRMAEELNAETWSVPQTIIVGLTKSGNQEKVQKHSEKVAHKNLCCIVVGLLLRSVDICLNICSKLVDPLLTELGDVFDDPVANQTAREMVFAALKAVTGNTTTALHSIQDISGQLKGVSLRGIVSFVQTAEGIRWPVTMAILSILLVFCVVLLFGVARHSRCALITFSVFGLFAVIISWLLSSLYLATAVALGDLCIAPDAFLEREVVTTPKADILSYYIRCDQSRNNPFFQRLLQGQQAVKAMSSNLVTVARIAKELYKPTELHPKLDVLTTDINQVDNLASGLSTLLDCKSLHRQYLNATHSVCDLGLYGLSFMLAASVAAGFFFTVLVWVDSHTWIYIRRRRDYLQVDEQDPFLPPTAASQAIAARTLRSQGLYGSTDYFWQHHHSPHHHHHHTPPSTPPYPGTLDGRSSREEKSQHGTHYDQGLHSGGGSEHHGSSGASAMLGPNHGQYATLTYLQRTCFTSDRRYLRCVIDYCYASMHLRPTSSVIYYCRPTTRIAATPACRLNPWHGFSDPWAGATIKSIRNEFVASASLIRRWERTYWWMATLRFFIRD
ncbi:hypothetical protein Cfor_06329 [Coptotermes formosanus]|uniref:Protein tweety homolog n=1 Tax=Coptotermes formosanus TaxID=36987 RepID=A0A6L2PJW9_COPFO|nr:hypothetical protein Cfor_06329 [Coptotermes formosanus]